MPRSLKPDHLGKLIRELGHWHKSTSAQTRRDALAIEFGLLGLRISEVRNLLIRNVDHQEHRLFVQTLKGGTPGHIFFPTRLTNSIIEQASNRDREQPLFITSRGNRLDTRNLRRRFTTMVQRVTGEHYRFHDLRHTVAQELYRKSGHNILVVSQVLRHKNLANTAIYLTSAKQVADWMDHTQDQDGLEATH